MRVLTTCQDAANYIRTEMVEVFQASEGFPCTVRIKRKCEDGDAGENQNQRQQRCNKISREIIDRLSHLTNEALRMKDLVLSMGSRLWRIGVD